MRATASDLETAARTIAPNATSVEVVRLHEFDGYRISIFLGHEEIRANASSAGVLDLFDKRYVDGLRAANRPRTNKWFRRYGRGPRS